MNLPVEVIPGGKAPTRAYIGDAGLDCYARVPANGLTLVQFQVTKVPLGIKLGALEDHSGIGPYEIQIRGRSGLASQGIFAHLGTVDRDYRGEVAALLVNMSPAPFVVMPGDRVAQLVVNPIFLPRVRTVVSVATNTARGTGGFGSTGA